MSLSPSELKSTSPVVGACASAALVNPSPAPPLTSTANSLRPTSPPLGFDLLGHPLPLGIAPSRGIPGFKKKRDETPRGYAAQPGTGPPGEFCRTCVNAVSHSYSKNYWKCLLTRPYWGASFRTDIRLKSPACKLWQAKPAP